MTHIFAEAARYYGRPFSLAVESFGLLEAENWRNVLLFAQLQHLPDRFSVEETDTDFTIWNSSFNFRDYVGDELVSLTDAAIGERPVANFVVDSAAVHPPFPFQPRARGLLWPQLLWCWRSPV